MDEMSFIATQLSKPAPKASKPAAKPKASAKVGKKKTEDESAGCTQCVQLNAYNFHQCQELGATYTPVKCASCYSKVQAKEKAKPISLNAGICT